jgi:hypothetical protein
MWRKISSSKEEYVLQLAADTVSLAPICGVLFLATRLRAMSAHAGVGEIIFHKYKVRDS